LGKMQNAFEFAISPHYHDADRHQYVI